MASSRTAVLVKPDGLQRGLIGEIISRFERKGLKLVGLKMVNMTDEMLSEWYGEDSETVKNYNETLKSLYKSINFYEKDYSKYYDTLFDYNAKNLINQILN